MKVLFIYKFLTTGGVEAVLRARIDGMVGIGVEGYVWFLEQIDGGVIFQGSARDPFIGDLTRLAEHLRDNYYDTISVIDTPEVFPLLAQLPGSTTIVVEAHTPYLENLEYLRSLDGIQIASIIVPSRFQASLVKRRIKREIPVEILPNSLGASLSSEPLGFEPKPPAPILAWIGRLDNLKNWRLAIKTASILRKREIVFELWVAGRLVEPATSQHLYQAAKRADLLDRLRWFDNFPHIRIHRWLDAVRESGGVVLATSKGESFGMSVAEAMARECPVVVPAEPPFVEFVSHDLEGKLFRPGSAKDAAKQIENFLLDGDHRSSCGSRARERILEHHHPNRAIRLWIEAITNPKPVYAAG